jgi:polynucleotide 5'-kinase involved in rRNA processing
MGNKLSIKTDNISTTKAGTTDTPSALQARKKYRRFRILVIGRANAGKTTLLKRVCNTTTEPCIYDEEKSNLVRFLLSPEEQTTTDSLQ